MFKRLVKLFSVSRWLSCIANKPGQVLLLILIVTLMIGAKIPWLTFSVSVHDLIVDDVPERLRYNKFKALFGTDEVIHVVVKGDDIFSTPYFAQLRDLSEKLSEIPGVSRVISLPQIKAAVDPQDQWSLERFTELTGPVSIFQRYLFSLDHRVSGITLILDSQPDQETVVRAVQTVLNRLGEEYSSYHIGMPAVSTTLARYAQQDCLHLPIFTVIIIAVLMLILLRSVIEMMLPLLCVAVASIWTLGAMAWCGISLNMLTVVVPVLQIAVGTAYCLYIFFEFKNCAREFKDASTALLNAYSRTTLPTVIAVFTSIAGIGSLMVTPIDAVRQFSLFACLGILTMLVAVLSFFPCLLVLSWPVIRQRASSTTNRWFTPSFVDRLVFFILRRRRIIFILLTFFSLFATIGILRIRVETNPLSYFKDSTPISRQFHDIYKHLSGSFPLHLEIRANEEDYFLSIKGIKSLTDHQQYLERLPGVDKTLSLADYLRLVNYVTHRFDQAYYKLPEADYEIRMLVNQFKSLLGRDILARYVNTEFAISNITMLTRFSSARSFIGTEKLIRGYCDRHRTEEINCHATGFGMVMSLGSRLLVTGQVWSLLITLGITFFLMYLMFFSIKIGAIAMLTNLFPILVSFGAMGWLGIDLSMGTCLIASIVVGLAIDDSIHYLVRYKLAYTQEMDSFVAMRRTLTHVGEPIFATSIAISAGFSVLMLSSFTPTAVFGLLMMLAMASALGGGLVILPALLSKVSPITLEEVFQQRIGGEHLQQRVPLLKGMTRYQVHRILKSGEIFRIKSGSHLFDQGDVADRIYVVISGVFDAVISASGENPERRECIPKRINRLEVGDVIGERGVMTSGYRCVSVIAVTPGEVLSLSQAHLAGIRRLHSRTACLFFSNLSSVLTEKLIKADQSLSSSCNLDDDTGIFNHDAFYGCIEREINRAKRFGESLALRILEIDDRDAEFKANPLDAERFIFQVARIVSNSFRKIDTIGRIDKSTLAVLLVHTTSTCASEVCSRLKTAFCDQNMLNETVRTNITCRFMDLDCRGSNDSAGQLLGPVAAIYSTIQRNDRHLLYTSPLVASD